MIFHLLFTPPELPFKANWCWLKAIFYHTVKKKKEKKKIFGFVHSATSQMAQVQAVLGNLTTPEPTYALCSTGVSHCAYGIASTGAVSQYWGTSLCPPAKLAFGNRNIKLFQHRQVYAASQLSSNGVLTSSQKGVVSNHVRIFLSNSASGWRLFFCTAAVDLYGFKRQILPTLRAWLRGGSWTDSVKKGLHFLQG